MARRKPGANPVPVVEDDAVIERELRFRWRRVMPLYKDPVTAGTSSPDVIANTPDRRAQVAFGEAYGREWDRLRAAGCSPAERLAGLEEWMIEHGHERSRRLS